jgi:GTP-binding protein YchF
MSLHAGIVGLPNVGKSTIFNALTRAGARVENYPFCTLDPHHGIVPLPDRRLDELRRLLQPQKVTPATLEVVDIAGLVRGAHQGEGLGNQFLGHIRTVDALLHVVRCFGGEVAHVDGTVDPVRDVSVVETELMLADLETVERQLEKVSREVSLGVKTAKDQPPILERMAAALRAGRPLRELDLDAGGQALARQLGLLTAKPVLLVANVDEAQLRRPDAVLEALHASAARAQTKLVEICGALEMEIALFDDPEEQALFLADLGVEETGLSHLAREAYSLLGLITFYTFVGGSELRAWPIPRGTLAPAAAGRIHSDFERGFIRAEVASFEDFMRYGGEAGVRARGHLRSEGKDYAIQDGDVVHFRFHV